MKKMIGKYPSLGSVYYCPAPERVRLFCKLKWEGSEFDVIRFNRGLVHKSSVGAIKHAALMLEVSYGRVNP